MARSAKSALVLQGGGALGAYELGAARTFYRDVRFSPDLIAGVSIGAVTAVLLARPKAPLKPLAALEAFWEKVALPAPFFPSLARPYASFLGNPNFFTPRRDYLNFFDWDYFYETKPLRRTLEELVDVKALRDKTALPRLLVSATNLREGQIEYFYSNSRDYELTLDHIIASGSLPPAFPGTADCSIIRPSAPCSITSTMERMSIARSMSSICSRTRQLSRRTCLRWPLE